MNKRSDIPIELANLKAEAELAWKVVYTFFGDRDKAELWFKTENPMLGNVSPAYMIQTGRFDKLMKFINEALYNNK
jgi:hypothetical protein